jgi:hypothetical protein
LKLKLMTETVGHRLQNEDGLFSNFRTNAVARENRKFQEHGDDRVIEKFKWMIENSVILSRRRANVVEASREITQ